MDFGLPRPVIRRRAVVGGRVQGVSFRYHTVDRASRRGLTGWVRNARDGGVELEVQGPDDEVRGLLDWVGEGPPHADVTSVVVTDLDPVDDERRFDVVP